MDIIITSNSPGEVSAWVKPVVRELKRVYFDSKVSVFLPPCVFASGSEKRVLESFPGIDRVFDKKEYLRFILFRKRLKGFAPGRKGIVVFLGGDLFHAVLLGRRFSYPVIAYTEGVFNWGSKISKFMVPDGRTRNRIIKKGAPADKVEVIGNLMLDAIEPKMSPEEIKNFLQIKDEFVVTLFPGSRPAEVEYMLPFFLEALTHPAKRTINKDTKLSFFLSLSPFIEAERLQDIFYHYLKCYGLVGEYVRGDGVDLIKIDKKLELRVLSDRQYSLMQITDLALTIPGTNNLELAYFATPMLVLLPLNKPEDIPLEGLPGLVGQVPFIGPALKRKLIPQIAQKTQYVALINRIANKEIVPELRGVLNPADLTKELQNLIADREGLIKMSHKLREATGQKGAARELVRIVGETLASYHQNRI